MSASDRVLLSLLLRLALLENKGAEFERFFTAAAIELWGDDFEPWKPQGRHGDFKCDGYRRSVGIVFQCNAPEQFAANAVASKIEQDFEGALAHFGDDMKTWIFVHNQRETPAKAADLVRTLRKAHPDVELIIWNSGHLAREIRGLSDATLQSLFPGFSIGHEFSEEMENYVLNLFEQNRPPQLAKVAEIDRSNRNAFYEEMDRLSDIDREVRRRLLGYSRWLDPATKREVNGRIIAHGFEEKVITVNAQRLQDEQLIMITENHYLAVAEDVCQMAADTLMDEFLEELST